jgi:TfoX N-terminal domain
VREDRAAMGEATTYEAMAHELLADPAVVTGKLFGHACLKIGGKVFVCEHEGDLLLKLPPERIEEVKAAGGRDFEPMGRRMNGWVTTPPPERDPVAAWIGLAEEAKAFVVETS